MHEIMHLMSKLFEKKPPEELRSERLRVWFTKDEKAQVELLADMRKLAVADFVRRAALGRRADIDYVTDLVLVLSDFVRTIREYRATVVASGQVPPDDELLNLIQEARAAMLRIAK